MKILSLLIIFISFLLAPCVADCCSCAYIEFDEQIAQADLVFVGKVLSRVLRKPPGSDPRLVGDETAVHRIVVSKWYKGRRSTDTLSIESSADGASCGVYLNVDSTFIVYAYFKLDYSDRDNPVRTDTLVTNLCTRNRLASDTSEIALLERYAK